MMNRRKAIQQLSLMGLGLTLYPACNVEEVPKYSRVPLDAKKYKIFRQISEAVLPVDHITYATREPRTEFILTILNDCTPEEDVQRYLNGLQSLQDYLIDHKKSELDKLSDAELDQVFAYLEQSKETDENLFQFYRLTKSLARQHFTGSEKFMTEELKFEFIPARYIGCANI